ncbi:hypothetical protein Esti_005925 [Eimeria stiedai]
MTNCMRLLGCPQQVGICFGRDRLAHCLKQTQKEASCFLTQVRKLMPHPGRPVHHSKPFGFYTADHVRKMSIRLLFTLLILKVVFVAGVSFGSVPETGELQVVEEMVVGAKTNGPTPAMRGRAPRSIQPLILVLGLVTSLAVTFLILLCFRAARNLGGRGGGSARRLAFDDSSDGGGGEGGLPTLCQGSDVGLLALKFI